MTFFLRNLCCVIVLIHQIICQNSSNSNTIHTVVAQEGQNVTLRCPLKYPPIQKMKVCEWLLPDGSILSIQENNERFTFTVDNWSLFLDDITPQDGGTYTCVVWQEADCKRHQAGYTDLKVTLLAIQMSSWEVYQPQVIRGVIAAAVVAFTVIFACLVYKLRWKSSKRTKSAQTIFTLSSTARHNPIPDDNERYLYVGAYNVYNNEGMVDVPL